MKLFVWLTYQKYHNLELEIIVAENVYLLKRVANYNQNRSSSKRD